MDVRIIKLFLFAALVFTLAGCATLPQQDFKFSLTANSQNESSWSQKGLASAGSLAFKFRLNEPAQGAADAKFKLGASEDGPTMLIHVSDEHCVGAYLISIQYAVGTREWRTAYMKTRLLWDEDSTLSIQWNNNRASIVINGSESTTLNLLHDIGDIRVDVSRGGIYVSELSYRNSLPALN